MPLRQLTRIALHLLLAVSLASPVAAAPARGIKDSLQAATATMTDAPCDEMSKASADSGSPCDCCVPQQCDFSACLGVTCLPELARVVAHVPAARAFAAWRHAFVLSRLIDTPLRPPIV
ncbi:hypothetical protein ACFOLC_00950 [Lysobacter cavernae]|uniref:CopL family metal-binding regulatory protein n=1 Tax=Lysobacter cavernae TaxID=1685901 RepID=A0ABV7RLM1_9GAMM